MLFDHVDGSRFRPPRFLLRGIDNMRQKQSLLSDDWTAGDMCSREGDEMGRLSVP